jgi:hypothetical protein
MAHSESDRCQKRRHPIDFCAFDRDLFRCFALRHRNFKPFFFGQSISVLGTWMTRLATSWLVYHLTHSALLLGIVGFAGQTFRLR